MKRSLSVACCAVVLLLVSSCHSVYMPNVPATPMFSEQGEVYVAAHSNIKGNLSGSAAVAVGRHVAVMANGSYIDNDKGNRQFKQYLYEGGLGYFTTIGQDRSRVLEVYGGYGKGNTWDADTRATTTGMAPVETREMDFDKIFVQVNYSRKREHIRLFGKEREFNYGTAIRASHINMTAFELDGLPHGLEENLFVEPIFYTRMSLNKSFQLQYTNGFNIGVVNNEYLKAGNAVFTLGLIYKLSRE